MAKRNCCAERASVDRRRCLPPVRLHRGGPSTAVAEVATELKVPFFGPMAGSPTLRRPHLAYVFPVRAEHREEFRALMAWGRRLA